MSHIFNFVVVFLKFYESNGEKEKWSVSWITRFLSSSCLHSVDASVRHQSHTVQQCTWHDTGRDRSAKMHASKPVTVSGFRNRMMWQRFNDNGHPHQKWGWIAFSLLEDGHSSSSLKWNNWSQQPQKLVNSPLGSGHGLQQVAGQMDTSDKGKKNV